MHILSFLFSKKDIPVTNYRMHTLHCARNMVKCQDCDMMINSEQVNAHRREFHSLVVCDQCGVSIEAFKLPEHKVNSIKNHSVWKSQKKSHSTFASEASYVYILYRQQFIKDVKTVNLVSCRSNSGTRHVNLNWTKIDGKCQKCDIFVDFKTLHCALVKNSLGTKIQISLILFAKKYFGAKFQISLNFKKFGFLIFLEMKGCELFI